MKSFTPKFVFLLALAWMFSSTNILAEWPAYRADSTRTGFVDVDLGPDMKLLWSFNQAQPPQPAWPQPARRSYWQRLDSIMPRVTDDATFQPIIVQGKIYFGSSADDHLYCLEATSGRVLWTFCTNGPIRYAPFYADDRLFFGSDDGSVYCLNADKGHLLWSRRIFQEDRRVPGNGRIISSWPIRTGCVVKNGVVFATAGLFPQQGTVAFALSIDQGEEVWRQKMTDSPQGYLVASTEHLYIPTGRGNPIALDLKDGSFIKRFTGVGGTFSVVTDEALIAGRGNNGTLSVSDTQSTERIVEIRGTQLAVTPQYSVFYQSPFVTVLDRGRFFKTNRKIKDCEVKLNALRSELKTAPSSSREESLKLSILNVSKTLEDARLDLPDCVHFKKEIGECSVLMATSTYLVTGFKNGVNLYRLDTGMIEASYSCEGTPLGMALSEHSMIISNERGNIFCYGLSESLKPSVQSMAQPRPAVDWKSQGYALVLGIPTQDQLAQMLDRATWQLLVIDPDLEQIQKLRKRFMRMGSYGPRITAHCVASENLPFTDYLANVIYLSATARKLYSEEAVSRVLRPHGGELRSFGGDVLYRRGALPGEGSWTHLYGNPGNTSHSGDEWTRQEMSLQWFGGPGPQQMVDRHLRGSAPLYENGMLIVPGENVIVGVDPYNGTELWSRKLERSQRYSMPYDTGYMSLNTGRLAIAVNDACDVLDALSGNRLESFDIPGNPVGKHWGYTVIQKDRLIGSIQKETASRTTPGYQQIDSDYRNNQPLVTSEALFGMSINEPKDQWVYQGGVLLNASFTLSKDRVSFVESRSPSALADNGGRITLKDLMDGPVSLVTLSCETGRVLWRKPLPISILKSRNILYLQAYENRLIACGSHGNARNDTTYSVACFDHSSGSLNWESSHEKGKPGQMFHGEQVHHPVIMKDLLITEPVIYHLENGVPIASFQSNDPWVLDRPGHSCGTLSAGGDCLFFRATNPTVLDLSQNLASGESSIKLSPSRTGCWINIIPAGGLVMIPEASAGCVCHFSLQTSMAFLPRR